MSDNQVISYAFNLPANTTRTRISNRFKRGILVQQLQMAELSIEGGFQVRVRPFWTRNDGMETVVEGAGSAETTNTYPSGDTVPIIGGQSGTEYIYTTNGAYVGLALNREFRTDGYFGFTWENQGDSNYVVLAMLVYSQRLMNGTGI